MDFIKNSIVMFFVLLLSSCGGGGGTSDGSGNIAPTASAGADQSVVTGAQVTLDGSASSDINGDLIFYQWNVTAKPAVSTMESITNNTTIAPIFTADEDGTYIISLVVNDGQLDSEVDTVTIIAGTGNVAPIANAGPNQSVITNNMVILDASASTDANSDELSYLWVVDAVPGGSTVAALSSTTEEKPTFTPDVDGNYIFSLTVSDGILSSNVDTIIVTASTGNAIPQANAGADANVITGSNVNLDGSTSSDSDGVITSYNWSVISVPGGSAVTSLNNSTNVNPDFTPDVDGAYQFSLIVSDGLDSSLVDTVIITAYPSVSMHAAQIELTHMSFQGNDASIFPVSFLTTIFTPITGFRQISGDVLGLVYCLPGIPYVTPAISSVPPATVYGCDNDLSVTHSVSANDASVIFVWTIPVLYVDIFIGAVPGFGNVDGYTVMTNVTVSVEVLLVDIGDGVFTYGVIGASDIIDFPTTIVNNSILQSGINQTATGSQFSNTVLDYIVSDTSLYVESLPDFMLD